MTNDIITEKRKTIADPILTHLFGECETPNEACVILLMCMTEVIARSIQSQDPRQISEKIKEIADVWLAGIYVPDEPRKPMLQ